MGIISSMCKYKKRNNNDVIVHNNYTQTVISTPNTSSSDKTQCSTISREPTNNSLFRHHYYFPNRRQTYSTSTQQLREFSDLPLFSTPFYLPFHSKNNASYQCSNPYIAQAYNYVDRSQTTLTKDTTDSFERTSESDIVQVVSAVNNDHIERNRTITRVESTMITDINEQSIKQNINDGSRLIKRSVSAPIDMFLIDISNEHVLVGQPVSMNIRHLLLDTLENHHTNSSTPIRVEPSSTTTYAHENLLNYIPYVCERYPNVTVEADQRTRNTLHIRVPSEFSHSLNAIT
ncbi:unnamed protein product [Adineta steineri]|uniref:Uncharacterized protein n=1 Tax=Adineta steineri TaxID=433720 RepID=A0A813ZFR0_9BILA|nr:unnamed protein product [Adineta steineri]CAF3829416.1 unnamed protein product [Adineta steineri]